MEETGSQKVWLPKKITQIYIITEIKICEKCSVKKNKVES